MLRRLICNRWLRVVLLLVWCAAIAWSIWMLAPDASGRVVVADLTTNWLMGAVPPEPPGPMCRFGGPFPVTVLSPPPYVDHAGPLSIVGAVSIAIAAWATKRRGFASPF